MSTRDFDLSLDRVAFSTAVDQLSPFFRLSTSQDIAETMALQSIQGFTTQIPNEQLRPPRELALLLNLLINTQDGALTTVDLIRKMGELYQRLPTNTSLTSTTSPTGRETNGGDVIAQRIAKAMRILYADIGNETRYPFYSPVLNRMFRTPVGQGGVVNGTPNRPTKTNPGLSAILVNTTQVMPATKNVSAVSVFMNSIPTVELSRATPYLNIQFLFGRDPTDSTGNLQTLSLFKFLEGAVNVGNSGTRRLFADMNTVSGSINGGRSEGGMLSSAGLELFCAPQTLVNANETENESLRTTPVLDPFRPFMSFKNLNIDVAPSVGLMSYKTAKMEFVLHDRTRLHEIADFIKPDLYGTTELYLEYGWSHPDVPSGDPNTFNPYGILINGLRERAKYGIRNVNFAFDDAGQVNITLDLFMKGGNDFYTETIAQYERGTENILRTIERLARAVSGYERRLWGNQNPQSSGQHTREIRGTQILEAANDWQSRLQLSRDMTDNLRALEGSLRQGTGRSNPDVQNLVSDLRNLYQARTRANPTGGALAQLSVTTQQSIENKFAILQGTTDQLLPRSTPDINYLSARLQGRPTRGEPAINTSGIGSISLGKLLLFFLGEPLANTGKYDDVQFVFYPFNQYAGYANTLNIAQFPIDVRYFIQQYTRYRTENLSRAANMTLSEFLNFVAATIIDDPAAPAYGIDSLYHEVTNRQTGVTTLEPRGNAVDYQTKLEQRLRDRTPDATFKMPQIDFYVECVPGKIVGEGTEAGQTVGADPNKSILRIHIFDRQATPYDTQANLLAATREDILSSIGSLPQQVEDGEEGIRDSHRATVATILGLAGDLIQPINGTDNGNGSGRSYRINGGPKAIKEFVMSTMPYILYGIQGTAIKGGANLSSQQDPALSTVNMLRSFRAGPLRANGEQPGGLPLSIIPCELSLLTHGCPLIEFAQQFFIEFQTGTTADNIYGVVGLSHRIEPGNFETDIKFAPLDAYGKYTPLIDRLNIAAARLADRPPTRT